MTETPGLRERKRLERRRRIETVAMALFGQDGFDGTTIEAIATGADIAPRTFFYYFATKEDVVLADYASRLERLVGALGQQPPSEAPWAALRAAFLAVAVDYAAVRDELVARFTIMAENASVYARSLQLQAGWEDALAEAVGDRLGSGADDLEPRLLAAAALTCMRSALQHWLITGHSRPLPELVDACFDRLGEGLVGDR